MTDTITNPPAFPRTAYPGSTEPNTPFAHHEQQGMTLRDFFAAAALQGLMANPELVSRIGLNNEGLASHAFCQADAMLAERARRLHG